MKKRIVLLVFSCMLCGIAYGQGTGYLYENPLNAKDAIIRYDPGTNLYVTNSWPYSYEIHFALTDIHNWMKDAHVSDGHHVKDFEVIDGYVFFCGTTSGGTTGFLGWFDINDVFYNNGSIKIDQTLNVYGIYSLENIEVYHDLSGTIHIAGYGTSSTPACTSSYKAFEAVGSPVSGMQYRVADLMCGTSMEDMVVTDDYVVYVSASRVPGYYGLGVYMEPFPKYNMFATNLHSNFFFQHTGFIPVYCMSDYHPTVSDPQSVLKATYIDSNKIAVITHRDVYSHCPPPRITVSSSLALRTYDVSPLSLSNPIVMTSNAVVQLPYVSTCGIIGFEYDRPTKHYVALFSHLRTASITDYAIATFDYSSGVPPAVIVADYQMAYTNWIPNGLKLDNSSKYAVCAYESNNRYFLWHNDIYATPGACNFKETYNVFTQPVEIHKEDTVASNATLWKELVFNSERPADVVGEINNLNCH